MDVLTIIRSIYLPLTRPVPPQGEDLVPPASELLYRTGY